MCVRAVSVSSVMPVILKLMFCSSSAQSFEQLKSLLILCAFQSRFRRGTVIGGGSLFVYQGRCLIVRQRCFCKPVTMSLGFKNGLNWCTWSWWSCSESEHRFVSIGFGFPTFINIESVRVSPVYWFCLYRNTFRTQQTILFIRTLVGLAS